MLSITFKDRNGTELKEGDLLALSMDGKFTFFARLFWDEKNKELVPLQTWSYLSIVKVESIPEHCKHKKDVLGREYWISTTPQNDPYKPTTPEAIEQYQLMQAIRAGIYTISKHYQ